MCFDLTIISTPNQPVAQVLHFRHTVYQHRKAVHCKKQTRLLSDQVKRVSKCWGNSTCASLRPRTSTTGMSLRLPCKMSATGNSAKQGKAAATTIFSLRPQLLKKENQLFREEKRMHRKNQAPHPVILNTFCTMRWDPLVYKAVWVRQQCIPSVASRCVTVLQWCSTAQFCLFYYQRHGIQQELHNNHARVHYFNPCTDLFTFYLNMYIDWLRQHDPILTLHKPIQHQDYRGDYPNTDVADTNLLHRHYPTSELATLLCFSAVGINMRHKTTR